MDYYIYYILLENNKYYISSFSSKNIVIDNLLSLKTPDWLLINRPIRILQVIGKNPNYLLEDYMYDFMRQIGINNVRGDTLDNCILTSVDIKKITNKIAMTNYVPNSYLHVIKEENYNNCSSNLIYRSPIVINEMINKPYFTPIPNDNTLNSVDIYSIHSMINNGNYFDKNFNSYNLIIYIEDSWRGYIYKSSDDTLTITIGNTPNYKDFWISIANLSLTETDLSRDYHILHLLKKC